MNKKIYKSPCACAIKITGRTMLSASILVGTSDNKVDDDEDIGFVKEQDSHRGHNNLWDNEW